MNTIIFIIRLELIYFNDIRIVRKQKRALYKALYFLKARRQTLFY
ncbi:hypothetical protein VCRA213O314_480035 [Vibrio crassostreae]|nr:hypothetical protein VCRA213O314_480035 [Vibrio crassostreae]